MYDSYNLRNDAFFETKLFPGVFWIPHNTLGKTRYSNTEIKCISKDDVRNRISNVYELIQYIQVNDFINEIDIKYENKLEQRWEIHKDGRDVLDLKKGCCSSYSGLAVHVLRDKIGSIHNFCAVSEAGWGHAINYIELNGAYYFFDISAQLNEYRLYVPIETGNKKDFVRAKFITGGCYKTYYVEDFIKFFLRYHMLKMTDFVFFSLSATTIPPVLIENKEVCRISFGKKLVDHIYVYNKNNRIEYIDRGMN